MTQFLVVARASSVSPDEHAWFRTQLSDSEHIQRKGRLLLELKDDEPVFVVVMQTGEEFGRAFDQRSLTDHHMKDLVVSLTRSFDAIAFFYGDEEDVETAANVDALWRVVQRQMQDQPQELYARWRAT